MYDCAPQKFTTKNPPTIRCDITNTSLSDPNYISTIHPILTALIAEEDTLRKEQRRQGRVHNVPHKKTQPQIDQKHSFYKDQRI